MLWLSMWCPGEAPSLGHEVLYTLVYKSMLVQFGTKLFPNLVRTHAQTQLSEALTRKRDVELSKRCAKEAGLFVGQDL